MGYLTAQSLCAALIVATLLYVVKALTSPLSKVPGPAISQFTALVLRWHEFNACRTSYVHSLHLKYGPVVRLAPNEVSFTSYDALKEIYGSAGSGYDKSEFYNLFKVLGRRTMFSSLDKANHARKRRIIADRYANSNVMNPVVMEGITSRAQKFAQQCEASQGGSFNVYIKLHSFACDVITHHLLHPFGTNSLEIEEDEKMMHQVTSDDSLQNRVIKLHFPLLHQTLSSVLNLFFEPRSTPLADKFIVDSSTRTNPKQFTLLSRLQEKASDGLDTTDIAAELLDHMVAGIDTTGDALCFLMWELSQPSSTVYMKKLQQELAQNLDADIDKLPYLDAVVQEGLRCFPAIPMSLPRLVPQGGRTIDDFFVPGNTVVSSQAYSVNRINDAVFHDPDKFNPDRWLDPVGELDRKRYMFAFSHGGRGCIGKHLALMEMKALLREVYSQFSTVPDKSMTPESMRSHDQTISARPYGQKCLLHFVGADKN